MSKKAKNPVKTVKKNFEVIEYLKENDGGTLAEMNSEFSMSKSTLHNHLSTLVEVGYVRKTGDEYELGLKFLDVGGYLRKRIDLFQVAESEVNKLAAETGELANLTTEEFGRGVYLYRSKGVDAVDLDTYVGLRCYLHNTAFGKAILGHMSESQAEAVLDRHGLPQETPNTVGSREELLSELETIQKQGYAVDDEERLDGLRCVAAPIHDETGTILGTISVSAPTSRMQGETFETVMPNKVRSAANVIELNIKY